MRWIVFFMAAAMIAGCAGLEAKKQAKRTEAALAETGAAVTECQELRREGYVEGYLGVHLCANGRIQRAWYNSGDPDSDLILRIWDYQGKLDAAVDAGEISYTIREIMVAQFGSQIQAESRARSDRKAQLRASRAATAIMIWQGLQPTYGSSAPAYRSPTTCTTIVPPVIGSGQSTIMTTNCY